MERTDKHTKLSCEANRSGALGKGEWQRTARRPRLLTTHTHTKEGRRALWEERACEKGTEESACWRVPPCLEDEWRSGPPLPRFKRAGAHSEKDENPLQSEAGSGVG